MVKNRKDLTPRRSFRSNLTRAKSAAANIKVVVRVRPQNHRENGDNHRIVVKAIDEQMLMFDPDEDNTPFFFHGVEQKGRDLLKKQRKNMKFSFDKVFTHDSDNEDVFMHSTCGLIETLMDGCNCSVFAYGATGAGKTHTMLGHNDAPGITLLTMRELFRQKEELALERDFELAVSYLEVYNENVQDLLKPGGPPLHLREDAKLGVMVAGITIQRIESAEQLFDLLDRGNKCRTQHATDSNAESSRSHAVFQVYIRMNIKLSGQSRLAKLSLIDLAGSEKGAATGFKGARFTEGSNINKSLLALGNCINSLADGQKHIPYRDSKLTRLLKDSLGGNCHTVMIANVSPSSLSYEDTYNTLKYATRAKKIKANVKKNVLNSDLSSTQYLKIIEDLNKENLRLKEALKNTATTSTSCENCEGSSSGSSIVLQIPETVNPVNPATVTLDGLFEEYKTVQERYYRLKSNYSMLQARVNIKEEANNRLSGFCVDTGDKELGHKKLLQTMDRLKRQAGAISPDLQVLDNKLQAIYKNIEEIVKQNPDLKLKADCEMLKIEKIKLETKIDEEKSIKKVQEAELQVRGMLLEDMATLMQPWYLLLRGNGCATDTLTTDYKNLCKRLQGACTVSFEDDEFTSDTASAINRTKEEEIRSAVKRKLPQDMDSTFVLSPVAAIDNKIGAAQLLAKVCHTPAKRPAKGVKSSPRILHKENKIVGRKAVVGTMGTSARFPASVSSLANKNAVKLLTRQPLKQRSKI